MKHPTKILHKRPPGMPFAPLTPDDRAIMLARPARRDYIGRSLGEAARAYRGERLPCPPRFEPLPEPPAVAELRAALAVYDASPNGSDLFIREAARAVLKMYD